MQEAEAQVTEAPLTLPAAASSSNGALPLDAPDAIYLGFAKGDYDRAPGRRGRIIRDDPAKYPTRDAFVGGWAGGEIALKQEMEAFKAADVCFMFNSLVIVSPTAALRQGAHSLH